MNKRIDGKAIAEEILERLSHEVKKNNLHPKITVILVGNDPASLSFIKQKKNAAERIGATLELVMLPGDATEHDLIEVINTHNSDKHCHGIIIQRPLPLETTIPKETLLLMDKTKDIDGFLPNSPFEVPVALAIVEILEKVYAEHFSSEFSEFHSWLQTQRITVLGKGETAGKPIRSLFEKLSIPVIGIDRSTHNTAELLQRSSIIVSCTGRKVIFSKDIQNNTILLSVGLYRGEEGKLHGEYDEEDILEKALAYSPTPGGVGPVNVACLMQNLVKACKLNTVI